MPRTATLSRPKLETKEFQPLQVKAVEDEPGVVEALVAVIGNTDDGGDIILPGACQFKRHPKIVWSHDLRTLVGRVLAYEEWKAGDPRLPADLLAKGLGALWFKVQFDLEDPESFGAYRKVVFHEDLGWSIGYETDPKGFKVLKDGRRALSLIYVWEASPTTFGLNQEARTMTVKSVLASTIEEMGLTEEKAKALHDLMATLATPGEAKSYPALEGSFEETQDALRGALMAYGNEVYGERGEDNDWYPSIEGTFDDRVVVTFRFWGTGDREDVTYQFPYAEEDGEIELGEPEEVEVTATVTPATGAPAADGQGATTTEDSVGQVSAEAKEALAALETSLEGLEVKKGAVLSEANASALSSALAAIQKVLAAASKEETPAKGETKPEKRKVAPKGEKPAPKKDPKKDEGKADDPDLEEKSEALTAGDLLEMVSLATS